ncbi:unnamed protein product [Didymodactylos carnosus]|uniref:Uncharacterized protein n=1 Tax=Didymodactylos carnosus TaxID=1234261 RepID=A0A8S2XE81_9BILA|nr:unnamed protein product [Didymodactylos carnosus]
MISWLENGVKDSLKIQIKRQMKALTESARTIQAFFKIAKDEQELQQDNFSELQPTQSYLPYFNNTVSTTLPRTTNQSQNPPPQTYTNSQPSNVSYRPNPPYVRLQDPPNLQTSLAKPYNSVNSQRSSIVRPRSSFSFTNIRQSQRTNGPSSDTLHQHTRQYDPCSICHRINHRTIDCYYRKSNGCYNCGHSGHQIKIQGHRTWIIADVATNLVTDLLLGTDWITQNSVIIDSSQQRIILVNKCHQVIAYTPFVEPPDNRFPVFLIDQITLPPYSEQCIDVAVPSLFGNVNNVMFESTPHLYSKSILAANALIAAEYHKTRIIVINASDCQRTLSKNTRLGAISYQPESNVCLTIPMISNKRNYRTDPGIAKRREHPRTATNSHEHPRTPPN